MDTERAIAIEHEGEFLTGSIAGTRPAGLVVIIANDRGCARHIPGLRALAEELRAGGCGTLMVDVGSGQPEELAARIDSARRLLAGRKLALLGLGEAAPAALLSAASHPGPVAAVIACGRDPGDAGIALEMVEAPVLLIAQSGQLDDIGPHVRALGRLRGRRELTVLHELHDPVKHALDVARAALAFLATRASPAPAAGAAQNLRAAGVAP